MSSANFFSMLEDNTSTDVVEIAKKRIAAQQQKPAQPKEATEKKAPQTTQKPKEGEKPQQGEKTQSRPQTSENRGRGRGQRPQTTGTSY
jgi:ribosomal protein L12E/L44/L45/RPP1/RPP2